MKDINSFYEEQCVNIHSECFNKDFDEVAFEPKAVDDSDKESQDLYGY